MVEDEINARIAGYEWIVRKHLEYGYSATLSEFEFRKSNSDNAAIHWWLRGAYDALLGLGIASHLGVKDVTNQVGCDRRTVTQAITSGYLTATRVGNSYIIHPLDLEQWLQSETKRKKA